MSSVVQIARFSETMTPRTRYVGAPDESEAFQGELERHWRLLALEIHLLIDDRRRVWERRQMAELDDRAAARRQRHAGVVGDRALDFQFLHLVVGRRPSAPLESRPSSPRAG